MINLRKSILVSAVAIVAIVSIFVCMACIPVNNLNIDNTDNTDSTDKTDPKQNNGYVFDGAGNELKTDVINLMPAKMTFTSVSAPQNATAPNTDAITLRVNLIPIETTQKAVNWSIEWKESPWLTGAKVADYIKLTKNTNDSTVATVECLQPFGTQIIITAQSAKNATIKAQCTVDYFSEITGVSIVLPNPTGYEWYFGHSGAYIEMPKVGVELFNGKSFKQVYGSFFTTGNEDAKAVYNYSHSGVYTKKATGKTTLKIYLASAAVEILNYNDVEIFNNNSFLNINTGFYEIPINADPFMLSIFSIMGVLFPSYFDADGNIDLEKYSKLCYFMSGPPDDMIFNQSMYRCYLEMSVSGKHGGAVKILTSNLLFAGGGEAIPLENVQLEDEQINFYP